MKQQDAITLDQLLAEYARLGLTRSDDGLTVNELTVLWNISPNLVLKRLKLAAAAGLLAVGRKAVNRIDGMQTMVPCYTINLGNKTKKANK